MVGRVPLVGRWPWGAIVTGVLVAFFTFGGIGNIFVSPDIAEDYRRWGYPNGFHYLTGGIELTTAGLLALRRTRLWGVMLGSGVMLAAAGTVTVHGEYSHAVAPLIVLTLLLLAGWLHRRARSA